MTNLTTTAKKKPTAKKLVAAHADELRGMTHGELFAFSREHGFDSRAGFTAFKKALLSELGIDYAALRSEKRAADQAEREAKANHSLTLYSDAKARCDRFAICDRDGDVVWYGRFFDDDRDYNGEQSSGEMAAAKKAVWFASKVAEAVGAETIRLTLKVDAEWLTWANVASDPRDNGKRGGKARQLAEAARRCNVILTVEHVAGTSNPADRWTTASGYQKWSDCDLATLVDGAEKPVKEAPAPVEPTPAPQPAANEAPTTPAVEAPRAELTDDQMAQIDSLTDEQLAVLKPMSRRGRKTWLYDNKFPSHAAARDVIDERLETVEV